MSDDLLWMKSISSKANFAEIGHPGMSSWDVEAKCSGLFLFELNSRKTHERTPGRVGQPGEAEETLEKLLHCRMITTSG